MFKTHCEIEITENKVKRKCKVGKIKPGQDPL